MLKKINYVIITNGDFMKEITYIKISDLIDRNCNIENFIAQIDIIMKEKYPKYEKWFLEKVVPDLINKKRNIIIAYKDNNIVGFVNLKKDNKEKCMSNLYIKQSINQKKIWNGLVDESIKWLETYRPKLIVPKEYIASYIPYIIDRDWNLTSLKDNDMIFNGKGNEFERIIYKKKSLKN